MRSSVWVTAWLLLGTTCTRGIAAPSAVPGQRVSSRFGVPESCLASKDLIVQALERLRADSPLSDIQDANQLLKRANDLCAESGEAWYYRSVVETKLGHKPLADYTLRQARMFPSDALTEAANPFNLSAPKTSTPLGPIRNRWALVIGIDQFKTEKGLRYTVDDANSFRDLLVNPRYGGFPAANVRMLTDQQATLRSIKESLNWLARSAAPDDLVVLYVASHGSGPKLDTRQASYILASDTETDTQDHLFATALPMVDLSYTVATRLRALRTAIFIDTCFSEAVIGDPHAGSASGSRSDSRTGGVPEAIVSQITQGAGRIIFAASRKNQQSFESDKLQHGYFTYALVQTLNQHPTLPLTQVFDQVQQQVSSMVQKEQGTFIAQNPVMNRSSESTDFALGSPSAQSTSALDLGNIR